MDSKHLDLFKHQIEIKARFMDIDALHHVNNARYLNFLEEARIDYCKEVLDLRFDINQFNILVARVEIDFIQAILYHETFKISTRISKIGNKSFEFESVFTEGEKENIKILATAKQILVWMDNKSQSSIRVPDEYRDRIENYEIKK